MASTVLAISFGIISYSLVNIGLVLQKKGASLLPNIEKTSFWHNLKNFFTNKFWLIGIICTNVSFVFLAIAMNQGPLSIVSPMQGVGLIVLLVFSFLYLKEKIAICEIIGIITIVIGIVILGVTNSTSETIYSISEINLFFLQPKSIVFLCVFTALVFALVIFSVARKFQFASVIFGLGAGILSGLGAIFTKAYMSAIDFSNFSSTIIFAFKQGIWWLFFLIMVVYNLLSEVFPQIAYQKGKVVLVAPIFAVMALIVPVFGGIIIFSEWNDLAPWNLSLKIVAIILVLSGVMILSYFHKRPTKAAVQEEEKIVEEEITTPFTE